MSPSEQNELYEGMEQTREIIKRRLQELEEDPATLDKDKKMREYLWDLWMINGILDHGLRFKDLDAAKNAIISRKQGPDFTFTDLK